MSLTPLPWLQVQVELEGSAAVACDPPPGRIVIVGPGHTFLQLAETIDDAFAACTDTVVTMARQTKSEMGRRTV